MSLFSSTPADPPMNFSIDLNFSGTGTLTDESLLQSLDFYVPGADHSGLDPSKIPIYDNVLGVANIVDEIIIYHASDLVYDDFDNSGSNYMGDYLEHHTIKLGESIKFAVNPATGLSVDNAKAALYFYGCISTDVEGASDLFLVNEGNRVWRTPYMSLTCLEDYTIDMTEAYHYSDNDGYEYSSPHCFTKPTLHLVLGMGESLYAAMYKVKVVDAPYTYEDTPLNPFTDIKETETTDDINEVLNGNIEAWSEIEVTGTVLVTEENVDFINSLNPTEYEIVVSNNDPNNPNQQYELIPTQPTYVAGSTITGGITVQNPPDCGRVAPVEAAYLESFCKNSAKYNPSALRRTYPEDEAANNEQFNLRISPNPSKGEVVLTFELPKEDFVTARVYNLLGQEVSMPIDNRLFLEGKNMATINISHLPTSTYLIEISYSQGRHLEKIVKQ